MAIASPRKQNVHHKRSRGQHHKQDHRYLKAYHPYLPLLLLVVIGIAINTFWTNQRQVLGASTSLTSQELLTDTNAERTRSRESKLELDAALSSAAQSKANDMVSRDYWSHTTPEGSTPWTFVQKSGYSYVIAGENLAHGFLDAQGVVTGWMNSTEHRANILNGDFEEVGFGIATSDDFQGKGRSTVVVAMYATPLANAAYVNNPTRAAGQVGNGVGNFASVQPYRTVSRIEMLSGGRAPWLFGLLILATMAAAAVFLIRHARAWHKLIVRGEDFILKHKTFDLVVLSIILLGAIMTRASGFIG